MYFKTLFYYIWDGQGIDVCYVGRPFSTVHVGVLDVSKSFSTVLVCVTEVGGSARCWCV